MRKTHFLIENILETLEQLEIIKHFQFFQYVFNQKMGFSDVACFSICLLHNFIPKFLSGSTDPGPHCLPSEVTWLHTPFISYSERKGEAGWLEPNSTALHTTCWLDGQKCGGLCLIRDVQRLRLQALRKSTRQFWQFFVSHSQLPVFDVAHLSIFGWLCDPKFLGWEYGYHCWRWRVDTDDLLGFTPPFLVGPAILSCML